jgi:hypothetical protein
VSEHLHAFQETTDSLLDILDDPMLDPSTWSWPAYAEPTLLRALPENAVLIADDAQDAQRLRMLLVRLRGRGFRCSIMPLERYVEARLAGERPVRPVMSPSAVVGLIRRHRHTLAGVAHRGVTRITELRAQGAQKDGATPEGGAESSFPDKEDPS